MTLNFDDHVTSPKAVARQSSLQSLKRPSTIPEHHVISKRKRYYNVISPKTPPSQLNFVHHASTKNNNNNISSITPLIQPLRPIEPNARKISNTPHSPQPPNIPLTPIDYPYTYASPNYFPNYLPKLENLAKNSVNLDIEQDDGDNNTEKDTLISPSKGIKQTPFASPPKRLTGSRQSFFKLPAPKPLNKENTSINSVKNDENTINAYSLTNGLKKTVNMVKNFASTLSYHTNQNFRPIRPAWSIESFTLPREYTTVSNDIDIPIPFDPDRNIDKLQSDFFEIHTYPSITRAPSLISNVSRRVLEDEEEPSTDEFIEEIDHEGDIPILSLHVNVTSNPDDNDEKLIPMTPAASIINGMKTINVNKSITESIHKGVTEFTALKPNYSLSGTAITDPTSPTTDYATFRLMTGIGGAPNKSSFYALHQRYNNSKQKIKDKQKEIRKKQKKKKHQEYLDKVNNIQKQSSYTYQSVTRGGGGGKRIHSKYLGIEESEIYEPTYTNISFMKHSTIPEMTESQAIFTIINVYVNNTMLFNSYALKKGGLVSVIAVAIISMWLCYSGKLMVRLFNTLAPRYRTFSGIAYKSLGYIGCIIIAIAIVLENMGRSIICLITMWDNILYLFEYDILSTNDYNTQLKPHEYDIRVYIAIISSILLLFPTIWMLFFKNLIFGSILGFISTSLLSLIVIIIFILKIVNGSAEPTAINEEGSKYLSLYDDINFWPQNFIGLALCIGIFISNLAGHACLPAIYTQMEHKDRFNSVLNKSWCVIFIIQMITGVFGYMTYGENTKILITQSVMETSIANTTLYGGYFWYRILPSILIISLIINLYVHVPIGVVIASEIPETTLKLEAPLVKRIFRTIFFMIIVYVGWILSGNIAGLSAIMGSILTLTISMIAPLLFKLKLDINTNNKYSKLIKIGLITIIITFILFGGLMFYVDILFMKQNSDS